ncbi:hypothetical protein GCM10011351_06850 [Paraliobacillus quinghaiensis]|uniref:Uncharacterized protein n=1 Tax=Paraliobacillus quinghaiensis TaxID=470815 RepID=A0A917WS00_9BACI|nr:hypothetical protein [Paraliobacillus quinghaiensis]GGM23693.1 hypothetical protein GCM10011351_06850 [Paraliobacillus quinghaiensis]
MLNKFLYLLLISFSFSLLVACGTPNNTEDDQVNENNTEDVSDAGNEPEEEQELNDKNETDLEEDVDESDEEKQQTTDLEESKEGTLMIEGLEEQVTLNLFQHEALAFSTYVPEDMIAKYDQGFFNVYANFNDNKNENARLFITNQEEAEITAYLEGLGFNLSSVDTPAYDFSEKELSLEKEGFLGRVAFFKKHEKPYALAYYYPAEYGDGFSGRASIVVGEIVWHEKSN